MRSDVDRMVERMAKDLSEDRSVLPVVAIVGRPNVGKSTFFNRMIGVRRALTHNRPGVTRDRNYGEVECDGNRFILIDTGGFEPDARGEDIFRQVREQALLAIEEADIVLLFLDGRQGVTVGDHELLEMLRSYAKPVLYVVNKVEGPTQEAEAYEFFQLGLDRIFLISSEHGRGIDALLDALFELLPLSGKASRDDSELEVEQTFLERTQEHETQPGSEGGGGRESQKDNDRTLRIALVGRPNVGKSSLANQILGADRQVIHSEAGTTRDSIDLPFEVRGRRYVLVDTAGVRRKAKITDKLEQYTVIKAFKAISGCDVALLMIDALEGVTSQEKRLAGMIEEKGRAVVILVNKWDLMEARGINRREYAQKILSELEHIRYAPVHFVSALTGAGASGILPLVQQASDENGRELATGELNRFIQEAVALHSPPNFKGHPVRLYYAVQVRTRPPTIMIFTNAPEGIRPDYRRYLENRLRETYGFVGAPIHLVVRARGR